MSTISTGDGNMISFVVPFYKSEGTVVPLYDALCALSPQLPGHEFEFVFIEDCGGDGTWDAIAALAARDSRVKAVQFSRNFGQHYAISAGLDICPETGRW